METQNSILVSGGVQALSYQGEHVLRAYFNGEVIYTMDTTPPELTITSPEADTYVTTEEYLLQGTAIDAESGIAKVLVNGEQAEINGETWAITIPLTRGDNALEVIAYNRVGNFTKKTRNIASLVEKTSTRTGHYGQGNNYTVVYRNATQYNATVTFHIYNCYDAGTDSHGGNYINITKNGNYTTGGTMLGWNAIGWQWETPLWSWATTITLAPGETLNIMTQETVCDYTLTVTELSK